MTGEGAASLTFNELLRRSGLDERRVLVLRHRPYEAKLNKVLEWLVAERPDLFDCYQSQHSPRVEAAILRATYIATFIRSRPKRALFVGLYSVAASSLLSHQESVSRPAYQELIRLGMDLNTRDPIRTFDLPRLKWHDEWIGRLMIEWPGLERSWFRWADRNTFRVQAIAMESLLVREMVPWRDLVLEWNELRALPSSWRAKLREWRGVYLIADTSDGKLYVGSAAGADNILQRWNTYAESGHGGNVHLRARDPRCFRFSILERVSPDLPIDDVVTIEQGWKTRLHTRAPGGLNEN